MLLVLFFILAKKRVFAMLTCFMFYVQSPRILVITMPCTNVKMEKDVTGSGDSRCQLSACLPKRTSIDVLMFGRHATICPIARFFLRSPSTAGSWHIGHSGLTAMDLIMQQFMSVQNVLFFTSTKSLVIG